MLLSRTHIHRLIQMLVSHFDGGISRDVIAHWLNAMRDDGWVLVRP